MDDHNQDSVEEIGKLAMNNFLHRLSKIQEPVSTYTLVCTIATMITVIVDFIETNSDVPSGKMMKDVITKLTGIDALRHPVIKPVQKGDLN